MIGEPNSTQDTVSDNPEDKTAVSMTPLTDEAIIKIFMDEGETEFVPASLFRELELNWNECIQREILLRREILRLKQKLAWSFPSNSASQIRRFTPSWSILTLSLNHKPSAFSTRLNENLPSTVTHCVWHSQMFWKHASLSPRSCHIIKLTWSNRDVSWLRLQTSIRSDARTTMINFSPWWSFQTPLEIGLSEVWAERNQLATLPQLLMREEQLNEMELLYDPQTPQD